MIPLNGIQPNPDNPRLILDDKFGRLVDSLMNFPKMMALRPTNDTPKSRHRLEQSGPATGGRLRRGRIGGKNTQPTIIRNLDAT